jgi:phospholipase/carboxylesterase
MCGGCIVTQPQNTPVPEIHMVEPATHTPYQLYVPSYYTANKSWPLVITCHGTFGFDSYNLQIREWKALAEEFGFIVAAPKLRSTQGVLPRVRPIWYNDLKRDELSILSILRDVQLHYHISTNVLLTGFSAGAYPMIWTGLHNPGKFKMLIARSGTFDTCMLKKIPDTALAKNLPISIFYGTWDIAAIQSRRGAGVLHELGFNVSDWCTPGGHARRPEMTVVIWQSSN